jgi:hypothetical protein
MLQFVVETANTAGARAKIAKTKSEKKIVTARSELADLKFERAWYVRMLIKCSRFEYSGSR